MINKAVHIDKQVLISVVICTYNRCKDLQDTLHSLMKQRSSVDFLYEVLVIDNNSQDDTREAVMQFLPFFNDKLRYFCEKKQGLSYAKNSGLEKAKGDFIVFLDDDMTVPVNYILAIYEEVTKNQNADVVLGRTITVDQKNLLKELTVAVPEYYSGSNAVFKRAIFFEVGVFDTLLGAGSKGAAAEDTDMIHRCKQRNKIVIESSYILAYHHARISEELIFQQRARNIKGHTVFLVKRILRGKDMTALKELYWLFKGGLIGAITDFFRHDRLNYRKNRQAVCAITSGVITGFFAYFFRYSHTGHVRRDKSCQKLAS